MSENSPKTKALIAQLAEKWSKLSDDELTGLIRNTPKGDVYYMLNPQESRTTDAQENGVKRWSRYCDAMYEEPYGTHVRYSDHLEKMQKKDAEIKTHTSNFKEMHNAYFDARKTIAELKRVNAKLAKAIEESKAVWDAAYVEGLPEAMNEARAGNSAKLLDLLDRRLLFALAPLVYAELEKEGQG